MYKVIICGSIFYETDDFLCANAIAHSYRSIGWKDVKVKKHEKI